MYVDYLFLLIFEKVLTFISGELDVFRMLSGYDNRIPCIVPCKSKMPFAHIMGTEIQVIAVWRETSANVALPDGQKPSGKPITY